jgi:hypothetical protein
MCLEQESVKTPVTNKKKVRRLAREHSELPTATRTIGKSLEVAMKQNEAVIKTGPPLL